MGFEADFLAVGDGERSGDAIAVRYGNLHGSRDEQTVVVIDGGTKETGEQLVTHLDTYYKTDRVDMVVSTHPDQDHASGLAVVLTELSVGQLIMHQPWAYAAEIRSLVEDGRVTTAGVKERLREGLQHAHTLETIAKRKGVPIVEPFAGKATPDGSLRILGPTEAYYRSLIPDFRCAPESSTASLVRSILKSAYGVAVEAVKTLAETLDPATETLDDSGETTAENNSSAIVLINAGGHRLLFTGDAGIAALIRAADYARPLGIDLTTLRFFQVPHHGSRRNVGPTILNRIKAPTAYVSAAAEGEPKHPSRRVVNALIRRGISVYATQGKGLVHYDDAPSRGWTTAQPLAFSPQVEEVESEDA